MQINAFDFENLYAKNKPLFVLCQLVFEPNGYEL